MAKGYSTVKVTATWRYLTLRIKLYFSTYEFIFFL